MEFRDPIHGFIHISPVEKRIIDSTVFQRLRRVRQLGLTSYVYHGAEHSRFGHCMGVMHLAGEAVDAIFDRQEDQIADLMGWNAAERKQNRQRLRNVARLAGLLHDVGHSPFSHTGEANLFAGLPNGAGRFDHEDYSVAVIGDPEIASIIDDTSGDTFVKTTDVCEVLKPTGLFEAQFVRELISSPWDVDKMDYLLRDSHYCGVTYGEYDLRGLIRNLVLITDGGGSLTLALAERGIHNLESLVLARYWMFAQVYFHDVRRAYDLILTDFIQELLNESYGRTTYPTPDQLSEYLSWDDTRIFAAAVRRQDPAIQNGAWRIANREHFKSVLSSRLHPDPGMTEEFERFAGDLRSDFDDITFYVDKATDHPERYRRSPLWLIDEFGRRRSFATESRVVRGLEEVGQTRIYADVRGNATKEAEIKAKCMQFIQRFAA